MRKEILFVAVLLCGTAIAQSKPSNPVLGDWEGTSLCTVPSSPCHNEHVVYHVTVDPKDAAKYSISADKIVNGQPEFMGTLSCVYTASKAELYCDTYGDWRFNVTATKMVGTLHLKDGTLYRNVDLSRK